MDVEIFIPVFNEEKIIFKNGLKIIKSVNTLNKYSDLNVYINFVDDASTDNTYLELLRLKQYSNILRITQFVNGPSRRENLLRAMLKSSCDKICFMDADLATNLSYLKPLILKSKKYDIVSGSRYMKGSKISRTFTRRIISFIFNSSIRLLFGSKIRDHECGFKIFDSGIFTCIVLRHTHILNPKYNDRKMFWDTEMWVYAQRLGFKVKEIPITWKEGKKSALRFCTELPMLKYMLKFRWKLWMKKIRK